MRASQCTLFLMCPTAYRRVCGTTHLATGLAAKFSWLHARTSALIREAPQRHTACASSQSNSEGSQLAARREADLRNPPPFETLRLGGSKPSAYRGAFLGGMSSRSCDRPGGLRKGGGLGAGGMGYGLRCRRGPGDKMRQAGAADPPSGFGHISCMFLFK
jgi:hypothetical protein